MRKGGGGRKKEEGKCKPYMGSGDPLRFTSAGSDMLRILDEDGEGEREGRGKWGEGERRAKVDRKGTHLVINGDWGSTRGVLMCLKVTTLAIIILDSSL